MEKSERVLKALSDHSQSSDYKYERLYRYLFSEEMFAVALRVLLLPEGGDLRYCRLFSQPMQYIKEGISK